jgi:hypothetical protein
MHRWAGLVAMLLTLGACAPATSAQHDHGGMGHGPAMAPQAPSAGQAGTQAPSAAARVELTTNPTTVEARQPTQLTLTLRNGAGGASLTDLQVDHARLLHLVVVSDDLASFDHVHPMPVGDGAFRISHTFPSAGSYRLFAEFTSGTLGHQTVAVPLTVAGMPPAPARLAPGATAIDANGARVQLSLDPAPPRAGQPAQLRFDVSQGGQPVAELQPFLGVGGHLVVVSQDLQQFAHTHPSSTPADSADHADHAGHPAAAPVTRYGPTVPFTLTFSQAGLHKVWVQFNRDGDVITAPFVVQVAS